MTDIKPFTGIFNKLAYGKSETQVFDDFLDMSICALSGERYEEDYLATVKQYKKEEVNLFCELFAQMVMIMDNNGTGLTDCLGEFFQNHITHGRNGQYFTPQHITDFMAQITLDKQTTGKTIMDPACGSGRMLLSAARVNRCNYFLGADVDGRCAKMTAINLCLNALNGEVAWMNSLTQEHWGGYRIFPDATRKYVPTIKKLGSKEGIIYSGASFHGCNERVPSQPGVIRISQTKLDL